MSQFALALGLVLILVGLYGALTRRDLVRLLLGFSVLNTGIHMVLVAIGNIAGRSAPILDAAVQGDPAAQVVDPLPQALVLTAIVIGLAVTALLLAFAVRLARSGRLPRADELGALRW